MPLLDKLQRRFGRFGVPHVTEALIAGQVLVYVVFQTRPTVVADIALVPRRALDGQAWRLLSFVFEPPFTNLLFALFAWYLFYLMGTVLENTWGACATTCSSWWAGWRRWPPRFCSSTSRRRSASWGDRYFWPSPISIPTSSCCCSLCCR